MTPQRTICDDPTSVYSAFERNGVIHPVVSRYPCSKVKSLALALRPQVLENWPDLGSRTALFFELLKFCEALKNFFGKRFFVEIA